MVAVLWLRATSAFQTPAVGARVERLLDRPIIGPDLDPSIGRNIQGPSVIRVPEWVENRLATYYLYFADHKGRYIRLAYADDLLGPWRVHVPGSLQIARSHFLTEPPEVSPDELEQLRAARAGRGALISHDLLTEVTTPHIASPDVHVDHENRRIVMYFHGLDGVDRQVTRVATSTDGIRFEARPEVLGRTYMRVFRYDGYTYAMSMPGQFYRSRDPLGEFEEGPRLFNPQMRHSGMLVRGDTLFVFWTQVGTVPERIQVSTIDVSADWKPMEGERRRRAAPPGTRMGGGRRATRALGQEHRLRPRESAPRPGDLRRRGPGLSAVCGGGGERHRHRRSPSRVAGAVPIDRWPTDD